MKGIALFVTVCLFCVGLLAWPQPASATAAQDIPPILPEPQGYPCENSDGCVACRACCYQQGALVREACLQAGHNQTWCEHEGMVAAEACKFEDCQGC